jgi:hypothetical protein
MTAQAMEKIFIKWRKTPITISQNESGAKMLTPQRSVKA